MKIKPEELHPKASGCINAYHPPECPRDQVSCTHDGDHVWYLLKGEELHPKAAGSGHPVVINVETCSCTELWAAETRNGVKVCRHCGKPV